MSIGSTIRAGAAYVEVTAETSKLQRNLTSAQAQLQAFGRTCTTVGKDLLMFSGAMSLPLVMAAKSFAGFDDSMRLVQAVTQATNNDFKALTVTAQRLGRETSYTAQQVADAMVSLGRMGFSPKEIQAAIADVLNLARATGTELAEAGDIAANSLRIFGLEADKMSDAADVLTVTANSSAQTLIDLFEALKMGGPQAAAAGESMRETCAALAILANLGIKGSLAGTALRKSFSQFAKVKVQDQLRAVGVETLDANGNLRKMAEIMRDIAKVMQTMPTAEKLAFAEDIFDIRGSLAGLTLTANTDELDAMLAKLMDVEGVAADTAKKMDAGLGGAFRLLMSAAEGAFNAIAAAMNGTLQPVVQKVTDVINVFTGWIDKNQGLVSTFALVTAGTAALGVSLIAVGIAAKGVAAGLAVIQTVTKGFAFVQGMCIAQAAAMKSSILLIGQAFANYRNLAIPTLVSTEQFCAALGIVSSAANRARAGIVLMSNAEAAAAAKNILAAKWRAITTALTSFRAGTIAATVATKAQAAVELICVTSTSALNTVRNAGIAITAAFTAANLKSAIAIGAVTSGNLLLAAGAKIAAGAMMAFSTVMSLVAAHPVAFAMLGLTAIVGGVAAVMSRGAKYTAKLSDEASKLREKGDQLRKTDEARMERLQQLASKQRLTNAEMAEARVLAGKLQKKYGDLGISIKDSGIEISDLNGVMKRLDSVKIKISAGDMPRFDRLKELSLKANLTVDEQGEANKIIHGLERRYGSLGVMVDQISGKIVRMNTIAANLQDIRLKVKGHKDIEKVAHLQKLARLPKLDASQIKTANILIDQLRGKYGEFGLTVDVINGRIVAMTESQRKFAEAAAMIKAGNDPLKETHLAQLERLKQLAEQERLTAEEQREAGNIVASLNAAYAGIGIGIDNVTGKLKLATDAQKKFNNATKQAALSEIDAEISELQGNIRELYRENEALGSYWNHNMLSQATGKQDESHRKTLANNDKMFAYRQRILALRQRKKAIMHNDRDAVTGSEGQTTEDKIHAERQRRQHELNKVGRAERRTSDIEKQWKREGRSDLENQIQDIIELRDEYKNLIQTMLNYEKSKPEDKQDKKRIAELERKMLEADREAEKRIEQAKRSAKGGMPDAERRVGDIERRLQRERQSELENEIQDILALRDEYKGLIKTMLDFERAKDKEKQDPKKIAELERKLVEADRDAERRIAIARKKAADRHHDDVSGFRDRFEDTDKGFRKRRKVQRQDRQIDHLLKTDKDAGITKLQQLVAHYQKSAQIAKEQFHKELQEAQADGKIDQGERKKLDRAHNAFSEAESMVDKYSEKLRQAQGGTQEAIERKEITQKMGAWSAEDLDAMLGTANTDSARTANATEQMVRQGRETHRLLRRLDNTTTASLTYS